MRGIKILLLEKLSELFEQGIIIALTVMMSALVLITTLKLGVFIVQDLVASPISMFSANDLLELFGFFLLVLIGLELLHTLKTYALEHTIHAEVVLFVALIAIARKVIILDINEVPSLTLIGIGVIIIALCSGYYFFKKGTIIGSSDKF
ncbi:MAG: phosphate-starvation-inducible PsiE family protein [Methanolobus sp.]|uniref:phosphate-starvation-inducible PsiE family protein n=1 Tax=Methanolobus sp. TaxID=1874737 RepID=UPI00272F4477|nr:phosphate-starvation-inducible PsiE family protein [Methanolobus sp.]MDP2216981.1 phosphate-starvation-inducible PsiE family protein [Methanolobus sp.]